MSERAKTWLANNVITLLVQVVLIAVAWGRLSEQVKQKVDRGELTEAIRKVEAARESGDSDQARILVQLSQDMRAVRALLCRKNPGDSYCLQTAADR